MNRRLGIWILIVLAVGLAALAWYGDKGLRNMIAQKTQITAMARENRRLAGINRVLARRIVRLGRQFQPVKATGRFSDR